MMRARPVVGVALSVSVLGSAGIALAGPPIANNPNDRPSAILTDSAQAEGGFEPGAGVASADALSAVPKYHPTRILVRVDPLADRAASDRALAEAGVRETARTFGLVPGLRVATVDPGKVEEVCARLNATPGVMYASPNYYRHTLSQTVPYGISLIKADVSWAQFGQGVNAKVAVLDTGIDLSHPDLPVPYATTSLVPGLTVDDYDQHGSHTSGTVAAVNNTIGVVGVAPQVALMMGKVLNNGGYGLDEWVAAGVDWAVAQGADVISMSLGDTVADPALQDSCLAAFNAGVLVVAAAGNSGDSTPNYPAAFPGVMAISALDSTSTIASFSSYGPDVSVSAPGVSVESTIPIVSTNVAFNSANVTAQNMTGSPGGSATGQAIYCNLGLQASDFPAAVSGNIAHIRRGSSGTITGTFALKASNAVAAGAVGVIISNNTGGTAQFSGTLNDTYFIPVVSISQNDGNTLQAASGAVATISQSTVGADYAYFSGTSMACPHAAGSGALLISLFKSQAQPAPLPPASTRWIIEQTAEDLGAPGRDDYYGWGLVNVQAALQYLSGRAICRGDLNADGVVDDNDFVLFVGFYDALTSPGGPWTGGDLNGDGMCDDSDFVAFAVSYNQLVCPN
jgi:serine protease